MSLRQMISKRLNYFTEIFVMGVSVIVLKLLFSDGWTASQIVQSLLIHETPVNRFIGDYFIKDKLLPENGG